MRKLPTLLALALISHPVFAEDEAPIEVPEAKTWVTEHTARVGGKNVAYTVTAGTMLMKNDKDEATALFGYTAYVTKGGNKRERPLMFAYNGGPGSASIWLHMGILGPQRAVIKDAGWSDNGPYQRVNNDYSIIDEVDLVMIDPVGTGFSKPVGVGKGEDFWGVDQDIKSVSEFIVQYLTENKRWASPKYILGESYGGIRSGGVAYYLLTNHMVALDGVILVSPFMEFATGFSGMGIDYHVEVEDHYYSVPYQLRGKQLEARITASSVECFVERKRIASHVRSFQKGRHTTVSSHMPKGHQEYADWTPARLIRWAAKTGPQTAAMTESILASRQHAQQAFRSAMGLISLAKVYTPERLEAACELALEGGATNYKSVKSILKTQLDQQPRQQNLPIITPIAHDNIRGGHYYH